MQESKEKELYLVTGANGFVGRYLVDRLTEEGHRVRAMIRDPGKADDLKHKCVEVLVGDMTDPESLARAVQGVRGVYHIAALFRQDAPERLFHEVNAEGVRRLLEVSVAAGVARFVHCSTVGVLGDIQEPPADEKTPYSPGDKYQRSKMEGEKIALSYFQAGKISGVVIRPAMIYGPGDTRTLKLFKMIARRRFFYVGGGEASVHWIDVRDLARSFILAMAKETLNNEVYIIAGKQAVTLKEMVELVARDLHVAPPKLHLPVRPMQWLGSLCEAICNPLKIQPPIFRRRVDFYTKSRSFDASKAERDLGFIPAKTFVEEIRDILQDYKERGWL